MNTHVTFETAKSLKEKGFGMDDEDYVQLHRFYEQDGTYIEYDVHVCKKYNPHRTHLGADTIEDFEAHLTMMDNSLDDIYLAPTISEVVMWLHAKHGIWISVNPHKGYKVMEFDPDVWTFSEECIIHNLGLSYYSTPTEAYQEAIKHTLENLI